MKLCRDCKHYRKEALFRPPTEIWGIPLIGDFDIIPTKDVCARKGEIQQDLVTGYKRPKLDYCDLERESMFFGCGKHAKFFEPKQQKDVDEGKEPE